MLSKSQIMRGLQCEKSLWLKSHKPEERQLPNKVEGRFEQGTSIGELAQQLFPGGALVEFHRNKLESMCSQTQSLIEQGEHTIYEATFKGNGIFASVDILHKDARGWHIYEVKGSTKVKGVYIQDATCQYLTVKKRLDIASINIIYVNNKYIRAGDLDIKQLFCIKDITVDVQESEQNLIPQIAQLQDTKNQPEEPSIDIGLHCSNPYPCDFSKYCRRHLPKPNVFNLYRLKKAKKYQYYQNGLVTYQQAQAHIKLNKTQKLQVNTYLEQTTHVDPNKVQAFVSKVEFPISYFDFETFNEAIPRFDGQRPYQQMPFQYSLHIEEQCGELSHNEFLADEYYDPRKAIAEAMLADLPATGSIMAFNQSFEISRIKELAQYLPEHKDNLLALIPRFVDLIEPFRKLGFYHPDFHGSFSIKAILPAMFPNDVELDYKQLDIQNGGMAMDTFANLPRLKNSVNRDQIRHALLEYCKLDTWAMVKIFDKLRRIK
ncbi:DUF2779 domain-containing protein [Psychrosphaera haliotis]|uniref:DUF2779 domain-containing protein n=1 Tax=Psychrosphaera haliotis TaxID=555083 RepID=A0A6N8F598_9GAMM|nr:DUF2779 domain-containing protein [Psychrosphaera haliotis]MUH71463.1 DUF2779 domain-containing protein [Psychrosphaera haliotis]